MGLLDRNGGPAALVAAGARVTGYASPAEQTIPSLTASATRVQRENVSQLRRLTQPWQRRALSYYDMTPEAHFAATYQGNMLSQIRLFAAKVEGTEKKEIDDQKIIDFLDRIHDPGSAERTELQRAFGRLMLLTGEGYLLAYGTGDSDEPESWEFVSNDELRVDSDGRLRRFAAPGGTGQLFEYPDGDPEDDAFEPLDENEAVAYRMWRPHPKHTQMADSPMQGVLDLFEELLLLQMAVRARVRSRLASSGMVLIADQVTLPSNDAKADPRDPKADPILSAMIQHMLKPIADEGSASAVVPFWLRVALEEGQKIQDLVHHLKFSDPNEMYRETGLRKECIERIATGMDFPAEILTGTGDLTHWNAWQVDEQVAKTLIFPVCALLCSNLTLSYFRPALREAGVADWQDYVVWYDPTSIVVHPDRSTNARELYDRGELRAEDLRDAHGYDETNAPDDEEVVQWIAKQKKDATLFTTGQPAPEPVLGPDGQPIGPDGQPQPEPDQTGSDVQKQGPPEPVTAGATKADALLALSEFALERCRELAGSRARSRAQTCDDCSEALTQPNNALVAALGADKLEQLRVPPPIELVANATGPFVAAAVRMGVTPEWANELAGLIETHAARTLLHPDSCMPLQYVDLVRRAGA